MKTLEKILAEVEQLQADLAEMQKKYIDVHNTVKSTCKQFEIDENIQYWCDSSIEQLHHAIKQLKHYDTLYGRYPEVRFITDIDKWLSEVDETEIIHRLTCIREDGSRIEHKRILTKLEINERYLNYQCTMRKRDTNTLEIESPNCTLKYQMAVLGIDEYGDKHRKPRKKHSTIKGKVTTEYRLDGDKLIRVKKRHTSDGVKVDETEVFAQTVYVDGKVHRTAAYKKMLARKDRLTNDDIEEILLLLL